MNDTTSTWTSKAECLLSTRCPHLRGGVCMASITLLSVDEATADRYCRSESFYDCPLFLSKTLRKR